MERVSEDDGRNDNSEVGVVNEIFLLNVPTEKPFDHDISEPIDKDIEAKLF